MVHKEYPPRVTYKSDSEYDRICECGHIGLDHALSYFPRFWKKSNWTDGSCQRCMCGEFHIDLDYYDKKLVEKNNNPNSLPKGFD